MNIYLRYFLSLLLVVSGIYSTALQAAVDSRGTEFMFAFPPNYTNNGNLTLFVSSETDAQGTIEITGLGFVENFSVTANTVTEISLPSQAQVTNVNSAIERGIRIVSDNEISVYGLNQYRYSTDAFLALPVDTLGLEYLNISYPGLSSYPSQIMVTGVYDDTEIKITPSGTANGHSAGVEFSVVLNAGESYLLQANGSADLTGTELSASAPISVMGAVKCVNVPVGYGYCDHIVEMLPPVSTWGQSFVTVPLSTRKKGEVFRVLASEDNTEVLLDGSLVATLQRGESHEQVLTKRAVIETTAPALVAQYSPGQSFDGVISDPFMMLIPPSEQFLDQYNFSTLTSNAGFDNSFVNVVAPVSALSEMKLDGQIVDPADFLPIGNSGFSGAQIQVDGGTHNIVATEPFGIYVYGFGNYDSYGYPGGMSFDLINPRGDAYAPNSRLEVVGDVIIGRASDSEDINANNSLDAGEDLNSNGVIDRRSEDINGNNILDSGEDSNNDGLLDRDQGIFRVELQEAENLELEVVAFVPGDISVDFIIRRIDPSEPASGNLVITDGAGNAILTPIDQFSKVAFSGVKVVSTLSNNQLDLVSGSLSKTPARIESVGDTLEIEWQFDSFTVDQVTLLSYDVVMRNPIPGENRLVLHDLEMSYSDVNGNPVVISLGSKYVKVAPSALTLSTSTDKSRYQAGEIVDISTLVRNESVVDDTAVLVLDITDSNGILVQSLIQKPVTVASNNTQLVKDASFNVGSLLTGKYKVNAQLVADGKTVREAEADFMVVTQSDALIDLAVTANTDRETYAPWEQVDIQTDLRNLAGNSLLNNVAVELKVLSPGGDLLLQQERFIQQLAPSSIQQFNFDLQLNKSPEGEYQLQWSVRDAVSDQGVLASVTNTFEVSNDPNAAIVGDVNSQLDQIFIGEYQFCDYQIENIGVTNINQLEIFYKIVNVNDQSVVSTENVTLNPLAGELESYQSSFVTQDYKAGQYACVLEMRLQGEQRTLAHDQFTVIDPVNIDINAQIVSSPRLLILMDPDQSICSGNNEIPGCTEAPEVPALDTQNQALNTLLADRSYTQVSNLEDFKRELLSGQYQQYLLLSEHLVLDSVTASLLREAVHRGDGLVFASGRAPIDSSIAELLGHEPAEQECSAEQATIAGRLLSELNIMDVGTVQMNQTIRGTQADDYIRISGAVRNSGSISGSGGNDVIHLMGWDNARNTSVTGDGGYNILILNEDVISSYQARGTNSGIVQFTGGGSAIYNNFQEVHVIAGDAGNGCADSSSTDPEPVNNNLSDTIAGRPLAEFHVMDVGTVQMNQTIRGTHMDDYIKVSGAVRNSGSILGGSGNDVIHLAGWDNARNTSVTGDGGFNVLVLNEEIVSRHQPRGTNSGIVEFTSGGNAIYNNIQQVILLPEDICAFEESTQNLTLGAEGIRFLETPIRNAQDILFGLDRSLPEIEIRDATIAGYFLNPEHQQPNNPDCNKPASSDIPAATFFSYGKGKSVFIGYDVLAELTAAGGDNAHSEVLLDTLGYTEPSMSLEQQETSAVTLALNIVNQGIETPITAVIHWPVGSQLLDNLPQTQAQNTSVIWASTLGVDQTLPLISWAIPAYETRMGDELTGLAVAELFIGDDITQPPRERIELSLTSSASISVEVLRQKWTSAIQSETDADSRHELITAQEWFEKAVASYQQSRLTDTILELLEAAVHLKVVDSEQAGFLRDSVGHQLKAWGQQLPDGELP